MNKQGIWWGILYFTFSIQDDGKISICGNSTIDGQSVQYCYTYKQCEEFARIYNSFCPVYRAGLKFYKQNQLEAQS